MSAPSAAVDIDLSAAVQQITSGAVREVVVAPGVALVSDRGRGYRLRVTPRTAAAAIVAPPPMVLRPVGELIREPKPTEWLVRGWIERGAFCMLNGAPASGKSFIAASMAASIASGVCTWFDCPTRRGPVIYLAGEGHRGMARRLRAWSDHHGIDLAGAPLFVSDRAFPMDQAVDAHTAGEVIQAAADQCGMSPELIVLDTVARHFGGDENSSQEVGALIAHAAEMGARWGAAVLLVHHSGHTAGDRARGSSAFRAAADAEYLAKREGETGRITLRCMKAKDHDEPQPLAFELLGYALPWLRDDGEPDTSAILRLAQGGVPAPAETAGPMKPAGANQRRALEVLRAMQDEQRRTLEASGYDGSQAAVSMVQWRERCGLERNRWNETIKGLQDRHAIVIDGPHVRASEP